MKRALLLALLAATLLGACTHSRIVQREPGARPPPRPAPTRPAIAPLPRGEVHVVRAGETLYGISFRYGLRYQDVAAWNGIGDPYIIEIGQRLRLVPGRRGQAAPIAPRPQLQPPAAQPYRPVAQPNPSPAVPASAAAPQPMLPPRQAVERPPAGAPVSPSPAIAGTPAWRWPAQGEIVGRYVAGDRTRQGVDIAGRAGQDVVAAADGVVVYSGAGLVGYGELIIVKHSDEWLSAYAHNQQRLVGEGTRVTAGQVIARMGRTGAARDMLHFEIRRNGKPVDPLSFLPRR